eukprot:Skav201056  [mRNA]  locus=scaffold215:282578:286312:- [translate_table: standard]
MDRNLVAATERVTSYAASALWQQALEQLQQHQQCLGVELGLGLRGCWGVWALRRKDALDWAILPSNQRGSMEGIPTLNLDVVLVTSVLTACGRAARCDRAIQLFHDCFTTWRMVPTAVSYAAVINACAKGSYWQMALHLFRSCSFAGAHEEAESFATSAAISACGRAKQWQSALVLLQEPVGPTSAQAPAQRKVYA